MMQSVFLQWVAICFLFLIASIWSEDNVRFGYVIVPMFAGIFWWMGWIQFSYLASVVPIVIFMGVFTYMRAQAKIKAGVYGSGSPILYKIVTYLVFIQFAIILVNGLAIFQTNAITNPSNTFTSYSIESAQTVYGGASADMNVIDVLTNGLTMIWTQFRVFWSIIFGFFDIYTTTVGVFKVPPAIATVLSAGFYLLIAIEIFVLIFRPHRAPEV